MVDRTTPKYRKIHANAQTAARARRRQKIHKLKEQMSCVYCGESNPLVIDFDHIDPSTKKGVPAQMITNGTSWARVEEEIAKCQPVCANCHRIKSIVEADKMQAVDIEQYIPESMKHLRPNSITE